MKEIQLTKGFKAIVDDSDFNRLSQFNWYVRCSGNTCYAARTSGKKPRANIHMHRVIMNTPTGFFIDHRNGNGLDNRKNNLKIVTHAQNMMNRRLPKNNTSGCMGVSLNKNTGKWRARICLNGTTSYLGVFSSKKVASVAYKTAHKKWLEDATSEELKEVLK